MTSVFDQRLTEFVRLCQERIDQHYKQNYSILTPSVLDVNNGRRYIRIFRREKQNSSEYRYVFAFVDRTNGDILKAATWHAPAKTARGNINEPDYGMHCILRTGPKYLR